MSAISNLLNQIKTAIYGEEVRDSIHDAIEQCYADVSSGVTLANTAANNANAKATAANNAASAANTAANTANTATSNMDSKINDIALVQANQPSSATNKIWVQPQSDEYQVPTWEEFSDLKSALTHIIADGSLWEQGGIASADGGNASATSSRIRTKTYLTQNVFLIVPASGYKFVLYAYSISGSYIGCYNGSSFPKSATWLSSQVNLKSLPAEYQYRIVLATSADASISPSDGVNCEFVASTDTSLTMPGVAADAKVAGDWFASVTQNLESIGSYPMNLFDSSTLENGGYYSGGSWHTSTNYSASDYIEIEGGSTYCCARYANGTKSLYVPIIEWYDANKTYINWANNKSVITFPLSAKYCRISSITSDISGKQIVFIKANTLDEMPDEWIPRSVDIKDLAKIDFNALPLVTEPNYQYACGEIICIGDSLTDGLYVPNSQGTYEVGLVNQNYPYYLGRMLAANVTNAGKNGSYPSKFYAEWYPSLDFTDYDSVVIWFGTNGGLRDIITNPVDTSSYPIQSPERQAEAYINIINGIKTQNPGIKITLCTVFVVGEITSSVQHSTVSETNAFIETLASTQNLQVIDMSDLTAKAHPELRNNINNTHFAKAGFIYIANRICNAWKKYFSDNPLLCEFGLTSKPAHTP